MKFNLQAVKSYATEANAQKAVDKKLSQEVQNKLHWFIAEQNGRFFPVFCGQTALQAGMHFHFNVVC